MKTYISPNEEFILKIPQDWYFTALHHNMDSKKQPYSFKPYDAPSIGFQISYKSAEIYNYLNIEEQPVGESNLSYIRKDVKSSDHRTISWITKVKKKVLLITHTSSLAHEGDFEFDELNKAERAVKTILILDKITRNKILPRVRWDHFMIANAASIDLSNRAFQKGSSIELVIILANQIDALLRQAIILSDQITNKTDDIEVLLIHQRDNDKPIFEKEIYKRASRNNIITDSILKCLMGLYEVRNRVVHRYIISDITSDEIVELVLSYAQVYDSIGQCVINLEKNQFINQIGIFKGTEPPDSKPDKAMVKSLIVGLRDKHSNKAISHDITFEQQLKRSQLGSDNNG